MHWLAAHAWKITNPIDSESMIRKEMNLAMHGINCSFKVRKSLSILLPHFITSWITNSGEEVLHNPFENGKKVYYSENMRHIV